MYSTSVSGLVRAARPEVYRALIDPAAVARWRVPHGMTSQVHEFDPREGGTIRVSLTYEVAAAGSGSGVGKTSGRTDTYSGRFVRLVPDAQVVEVLEFETSDPALAGEMTVTTTLRDVAGGTEVTVAHDGIPDVVPSADNELGTRMSLAKLAVLVEGYAPS
jgi:uncharacterized protein YndB with AHSA1/START domain